MASSGGCTAWCASTADDRNGWQFDFQHLYRKSGSVARFYDFAADLRALVARQSLPGYVLGIERMPGEKTELLTFRPVPPGTRG